MTVLAAGRRLRAGGNPAIVRPMSSQRDSLSHPVLRFLAIAGLGGLLLRPARR
jgi:hypothetical protein